MAIRVRALLRKWFGRGMYPTAEQFSDLFDSFFHKTEDKIPMSGVEGLTDQLNGKYSTAEGRELEKRVQKVTTDLSVHVASSEKAFNEVQNDIETLDRKIDDEAQKRGQGDAATLRAANEHTDAAVAEEASARESGDRATLQSAKDYVDKAIAELVDGSPAALDTLKELSAALGNDPNFATTVATQIGRKVDKVAGKGLSTEDYTSEEKAKLAGISSGANNYRHPASHPASMIEQDATHRFITDTERSTWNGKASTAVATQSANGMMSSADKKKLDGVATGANNCQHPATHPASVIVQDSTHRFVTDSEKSSWNNKAARDAATQISKGLMSAADKKKLDNMPEQCLISSSTMTLSSTLKLSSNVSYLEGRGYVSHIRDVGQVVTSLTIDSTITSGTDLPRIIELVLRCRAGLENNLTISLLLAGDAANSSIAIPKGSKLITLSFMMLNGHIDKYSCYRVSVI